MNWNDEGIIVGHRPHGESSVIVSVFTRNRGVWAGLARSPRQAQKAGGIKTSYEAGMFVLAHWQARLEEHLGNLKLDIIENPASRFFHDYRRLLAITAAGSLIHSSFPERQAHPDLYDSFRFFLNNLADPQWLAYYVRFEAALLTDLGFGLDTSTCAVTGQKEAAILKFISPRTGRAVSIEGAGHYADRLLPLPEFLNTRKPANDAELSAGLKLTGFFLERHAFPALHKRLPLQRLRLMEAV